VIVRILAHNVRVAATSETVSQGLWVDVRMDWPARQDCHRLAVRFDHRCGLSAVPIPTNVPRVAANTGLAIPSVFAAFRPYSRSFGNRGDRICPRDILLPAAAATTTNVSASVNINGTLLEPWPIRSTVLPTKKPRLSGLFPIAGAGSKPVPATTGSPTHTELSMSSTLAYRIEERWDLSDRKTV
jgi:hypothetical protein